jgi:hypothetical protein
VYCINPYPNGITLSVHKSTKSTRKDSMRDAGCKVRQGDRFLPSQFHLRFRDTRDFRLPAGKYYLYKDHYEYALEQTLSQLRKDNLLDKAVFYFGTTVDPFSALNKKFNVTMSCLDLLQQYRPGLVVVQTRSPMVISGLALFKMMAPRVVVAMSVETRLESAVQRYTPGQPRIKDRLIGADGLRAQGIPVNLVASPLLPYGEYYRDAWEFAELLDKHADFISTGCLASGEPGEENQLRALPLARRLAADSKYRWLRPYAHRQLYYALKVVAPQKLRLPAHSYSSSSQLSLFAA